MTERIRLNLVPIDAEFEITGEGYSFKSEKKIPFEKMQVTLSELEGVSESAQFKSWSDFVDECYYAYESGDILIKFEINHGTKNLDKNEVSCISIHPKLNENSLMKAVEFIEEILAQLPLKIYSVSQRKFVTISELRNKILQEMKNE